MEELTNLIRKAHEGDQQARDKLVLDNVGLVWSTVRHFGNRGCDPEDLFQIGCIGLLKAIDKFNLEFDVKFSTYAVPMITGEIKRFLRDDGMLKVSRSVKELGNRVRAVREAMTLELGREPGAGGNFFTYGSQQGGNRRILRGRSRGGVSLQNHWKRR